MVRMRKPVMLWFDCTSKTRDPIYRVECSKFFEIACSTHVERAAHEIARLRPKVLCFDFDYPDKTRLRIMQAVKRDHMSMPVLMLTVEHSEALAVWAFRSRAWNYLVKPIGKEELRENLDVLQEIVSGRQRTTRAVPLPEPDVPQDVRATAPEDSLAQLLPAVCFVEQRFNERFTAEEVASLCGLNRFNFSRLFHRTFEVTFQEYVLRHRVREACRLLRRPGTSVTEAGYATGFNDASYFSRIFKRYVGRLPSEYAADQELEASPSLAAANS